MAKIANDTTKPGAWVVNSNDRGRKSIKNGKVYLTDSEEFQIELFNPLTECVLADIKLNGQPISKTGLVLKPGQRFYLDCFIDDKKKFIFSTYEVEQTLESLSAINNNGKLEVFFYKESVVSVRNWRDRFNTVIIERYYPSYPTYPYWTTTPYYGTGTNIGTVTTNTTLTTLTSNSSSSYTLNGNTMAQLNNSSSIPIAGSLQNQIETGRVERGDKSNQKFTEVNMDFDKYHISSVVIELLPESRKPETASELSKKLKGDSLKKKVNEIELKKEWEKIKEIDGILDLIKKLDELHKAGILTDDEFSEKKKELLSKIC
jgi:hypothetical protein